MRGHVGSRWNDAHDWFLRPPARGPPGYWGFVTADMVVARGASRTVLLIGRWALKLPSLYGWRTFLKGLLHNMRERDTWAWERHPGLAPVLWCLPGGWLLCMRRAGLLRAGAEVYLGRDACLLADDDVHAANVGVLDGRTVIFDYGGWR